MVEVSVIRLLRADKRGRSRLPTATTHKAAYSRRAGESSMKAGIETTYNEHGDKAAEITRSTEIGSEQEQSASRPGLPSYSEVRYSYQYDDHGNWTEEIVSYRSSPGGAFESSSERQRTLTYY